MDALVTDLTVRVLPHVRGPFALFGHSMGALVAFELAHRLRRFGVRPTRLLVSGQAPPGAARRSWPPRHELPDDELWEEVRRLNGTSAAACDSDEIRRLFTEAIRADFALAETYLPESRTPLECPISVFGGRTDPEVAPAELGRWSAYTTRGYTVSVLPGDHFYLHQDPHVFLDALDRELHPAAGPAGATTLRGTMR
jgi:medium-chain acyl-[acyl-carrier-protein] hydrolase